MEVLVLIFLGNSMVAVPMYIPTNSAQGFPFLYILPSTYLFFFFFIIDILPNGRWIPLCVCVCVFFAFRFQQ